MARGAPRLVLYGPDTKHGARHKKAFKDYRWYIVHGRIERSTGAALHQRRDAEIALANYIREETGDRCELFVIDAIRQYALSGPERHTRQRIEDAGVHLDAKIGRMLCVELDKELLNSYYNARIAEGAAPWTAWTELARLRTAVKFALGDNYKRLWLPPKPEPAGVAVSRSQIARLLWACRALHYKRARRSMALLILTSVYCCQREEACTQLSWSRQRGAGHVDLDTMRISFKRLGEAENKKARGDMPIPRPLRVFLKHARKHSETWLFPSNKTDTHVVDLSNSWEKVRRIASLPIEKKHDKPWDDGHPFLKPAPALATLRFHDLIHTGATWRARSTPQHILSRLINKTAATLSTVYLHAEQDELEEAAMMSPGKRQRR